MNWKNKYSYRNKKDIKATNPSNNPYVFENMFRGNPYIKEVSLHKETIYIEEKAFKDCVSLEKINIPPKVQYLTSKMFYGCVSLREIIVESPIPPKYYPEKMCCMADAEFHDDDRLLYFCVRLKKLFTEKSLCFEGVAKKKCIIRVPKGSVELYKKAHEWKKFENIVEF
ncbi:MAG: leucine-rich repeat protein [Bacteroidales bacterium]|nr:leucine-rich repeat protein [Bacteroidales bacterium]